MAVFPPANHTKASVENSQAQSCRINQTPQSVITWPALPTLCRCHMAVPEMPRCSYLVSPCAVCFTEGKQNTILQTLSNLYNKIWVQTLPNKTHCSNWELPIFPNVYIYHWSGLDAWNSHICSFSCFWWGVWWWCFWFLGNYDCEII